MLRIFLVAGLLALAACQHKEATVGGIVTHVAEAAVVEEPADDSGKSYEPPMVPEVAWTVEVRLDDGSTVSVQHNGSRRYEPGERVRVLIDSEGELLL